MDVLANLHFIHKSTSTFWQLPLLILLSSATPGTFQNIPMGEWSDFTFPAVRDARAESLGVSTKGTDSKGAATDGID